MDFNNSDINTTNDINVGYLFAIQDNILTIHNLNAKMGEVLKIETTSEENP